MQNIDTGKLWSVRPLFQSHEIIIGCVYGSRLDPSLPDSGVNIITNPSMTLENSSGGGGKKKGCC